MSTSRRPSTKKPKSGSRGLWGLLILVILITIGYLIGRGLIDLSQFGVDPEVLGSAQEATSTSVGGGGSAGESGTIEAFFTTPSLIYPDQVRDRIPPAHERAILADIDTAVRSIDMATYEYNLSSIAEALVRAQERGVLVRLALDRENLDDPAMAKWAGIVEDAGIPISWEESDAFLHSKFIIVDERLVWTGSWNATTNDTYRNNNNLLRITLPSIVENYRAEFEQMAAGHFGTAKNEQTPHPLVRLGAVTIENYFSPRDRINTRLADWIDRARQSVDFLAFSYTSNDIADAMIRRQSAGVPVRGVFETRNIDGTGSEYSRLRKKGVTVLPDGNCYTMHHKVIIIDQRVVITGSYNFTGRAEDVNDENLLIIDDPELARAYVEEFERVFAQAQNPIRCQ